MVNYDSVINQLVIANSDIKEKISSVKYKRFIFDTIFSGRPYKSILGPRGVGKTTLLVQLALKNDGFYIGLDSLSLSSINLLTLLKEVNEKYGVTNFYLDEVQSLNNWEINIKDVFEYSDFNIVFTGSSILELDKGSVDLSRRIVKFYLPPFSFREFLLFRKDINLSSCSYDDLLNYSFRQKKFLEVSPFISYVREFMDFGAYPFTLDSTDNLLIFENILNKTFHHDFLKIRSVDSTFLSDAYKILCFISQGSQDLSYTHLSSDLGISKSKVLNILGLLEKSMLVVRLDPRASGRQLLRKHPKFVLPLPVRVLINKLNGINTDIGNLREDFFVSSLYFNLSELKYLSGSSLKANFYFKGTVFEIGGKNKSMKQIANIKDSFIISDSNRCDEKTIPLILFGFLY